MAGYEVTFKEFCQLISYEPYRRAISALLKDWYQYEIVGHDETAVIRSASDQPVSIEVLHQRIQGDPAKQYQLYQAAMTLWH
jgi:hypothetical protein